MSIQSIIIILYFSITTVYSLEFSFLSNEGEWSTVYYESPAMIVPGTNNTFCLINKTIFLPTDNYHGCSFESMIGSNGKIVLVDSNNCDESSKIRNAFHNGAIGLVIYWYDNSLPGFDWHWAALSIKSGEHINLPTVEILQSQGEFIIQQIISESSYNATISFSSGSVNEWYIAENSIAFILLFRVFLTLLFMTILCYTFFLMVFNGYRKYHRRMRPIKLHIILFGETVAYIYYLTILSCIFAICYVGVDPMHSQGLYNAMIDSIFTTLSLPLSFITTFLIAYSIWNGLRELSIIDKTQSFRKIILSLITFATLVFLSDLISSILKGSYRISESYVDIAGTIYLLFPIVAIIFFLIVFFRFRNIFSDKIDNDDNVFYRRFRNVTIGLSVLYGLWLIAISLGFTSIITYPSGRISMFFFYFFLTSLIHIVHLYFIMIEPSESKDLPNTSTDSTSEI